MAKTSKEFLAELGTKVSIANNTIKFSNNIAFDNGADLVFPSNSGIIANGTYGLAGQVLTSNGSASYWANAGGGGGNGTINTAAQYTWTNNHTFTANVNLNKVIVNSGYTPGVGQVDVLNNTGDFQMITLRDLTNPDSDKRNLALIGKYDNATSKAQGFVYTSGDMFIASNKTKDPGIGVWSNGDVQFFMGKAVVGSQDNPGEIKIFSTVLGKSTSISAGPNSVDWKLILPPDGGQNGYYLQTDGNGKTSWAAGGGGGGNGSPGGTSGQIQYNDAGAFGANPNLFYDKNTGKLGVGTSSPTGTLTVNSAYTGGIGHIDVLNSGDYQHITLRDPSNPAAFKRNVTLIGRYHSSNSTMQGWVASDGELFLSANGAGFPAIYIATNNDVKISGKTIIEDGYTPGFGQLDIINSNDFQHITLRDPSNPGTNKRNVTLIGKYHSSNNTMQGWVASDGELFLSANGATTPAIYIATNNDVKISGKTTVEDAYTPGIGQVDVLNSGDFQMVTLRDLTNPASDKRNLALIGKYDSANNIAQGFIYTAGDMFISSSKTADAQIALLSNGDINLPNGKLAVGRSGVASNLKLYGATGASPVTITAPANPTAWSLTLPANSGVSGQVLQTDGTGKTSWVTGGGGGGNASPAGSTTQIQFNNAGVFGANANFVYSGGKLGLGTAAPTGTLTVNAAYTGGIGHIDVLNSGDFQHITLRDPANPAASKRNVTLIGKYTSANSTMQGWVASDGELFLAANGAGSPAIWLPANGDVTFGIGKTTFGSTNIPGLIKIFGAAGANQVTVAAPSNPTSWTMTLPANTGVANYYLQTDGTGVTKWAAATGGNATPGGATTQIQYNNAGAFAGNSNFVYNAGKVGIGLAAPTAPLTVNAAFTAGIGQVDVLNSNDYQMITLRDLTNPGSDKRNLALIGKYDSATSTAQGFIYTAGDMFISSVKTADAQVALLGNGDVQMPNGKLVVGRSGVAGNIKIFSTTGANPVTVTATASTTAWTMSLPANTGVAGQYLQTDGTGKTKWANAVLATPYDPTDYDNLKATVQQHEETIAVLVEENKQLRADVDSLLNKVSTSKSRKKI